MITRLNKFNMFPNQSGDMLNLSTFVVQEYYSTGPPTHT